VLPEQHFSLQHTLSNDTRADCILFLPKPTGNIVIDAKFPLENYHKITDTKLGEADTKLASQQFKRDIKQHIQDIASKYIIPNETADGAIMFIPAEAVFAEIHAHHPDLVEASHKAKVWITSPTTMMAILTTARAVLKDDATRKQVHIIQEHLGALAKDFQRFEKRMDGLQRHIEQASDDVKQVNVSAKKITSRFSKIEKVEIQPDEANIPLIEE
jgi:DNA recombination protein RmuC